MICVKVRTLVCSRRTVYLPVFCWQVMAFRHGVKHLYPSPTILFYFSAIVGPGELEKTLTSQNSRFITLSFEV